MANFLQAWRKSEICTTRPGGPSPPDKSDIDNQGLAVATGGGRHRHHRHRHHRHRHPHRHLRVSRSILQHTDIPAPSRRNSQRQQLRTPEDHNWLLHYSPNQEIKQI